VKNNAGFLSSKDVLLGVYVHPMSLIQKFVKEKENAAAN